MWGQRAVHLSCLFNLQTTGSSKLNFGRIGPTAVTQKSILSDILCHCTGNTGNTQCMPYPVCVCVCVNGQPINLSLPDYRSWYQLCCPKWRQADVLRLSSELLAQTWLRAHTYNHANHNQQYETCLTHWRHIISWPWRENCKTRLVVFACRRLLFSSLAFDHKNYEHDGGFIVFSISPPPISRLLSSHHYL